jgi:hypothetical protein
MRFRVLAIISVLAACAGPRLPSPNSAQVQYDERHQAVQVMVSSLQPPSAVALISAEGRRYPASGISLLSGPHVGLMFSTIRRLRSGLASAALAFRDAAAPLARG